MKAILVIDKPKTCDDCRLHLESSSGQYRRFCVAKNEISVGKKKPKWCPLRPIPSEACEKLVQGLDAMEKMKTVEVKVVRRTE